MLLNLHVKNLAIIDEIDVDFSEGLNIISGETGAGKSIIIGSINIALGAKVPKDIIRNGEEYAVVELLFSIDSKELENRLKELDIQVSDNQLLISRKIVGNKSISKINGDNVTGGTLKKVAEVLIDIHSQHENQTLLDKNNHIRIIDEFYRDRVYELKKEINLTYGNYIKNKKILNESNCDTDKRLREMSFLEYEINEIESASIKLGEDDELSERYKVLSNMDNVISGLSEMYSYTGDNKVDTAAECISHAIKAISRISDVDDNMRSFHSQLTDIEGLLNDLNKEVSDYLSDTDDYSEELSEVENRLDIINTIKSKYGNTIEDIEDYYNKGIEKFNRLHNYDEFISNIKDNIQEDEVKLEEYCSELSIIRKRSAVDLRENIVNALKELNFLEVRFDVNFKRKEYSSDGFDDVEFIISTNPGENMRPLTKVASGGELSRIMLALKSIMSDIDNVDTLIFDEIDTGISGRTAQKVSEKLSLIANNKQVICITHLPQIASMADTHFIIEKMSDSKKTYTNIRKLDSKESIDEIARIIGGAQITEAVRNNAKEMIELAKQLKTA